MQKIFEQQKEFEQKLIILPGQGIFSLKKNLKQYSDKMERLLLMKVHHFIYTCTLIFLMYIDVACLHHCSDLSTKWIDAIPYYTDTMAM